MRNFLATFTVLLLFVVSVGCKSSTDVEPEGENADPAAQPADGEGSTEENAAAPPSAAATKVSSLDMTKEFLADKDAANAKYSGKTMIVTGVIVEKSPASEELMHKVELPGTPPLADADFKETSVNCTFEKRDPLKGLRIGQEVEIEGTFFMYVYGAVGLQGCKIVKVGPVPPDSLPDRVIDELSKAELEKRQAGDKTAAEKLKGLGVEASHDYSGVGVGLTKDNLAPDGHIKPEIVALCEPILEWDAINASNIELADAALEDIAKFRTLRKFQAYRGKFTDAGLKHLANLPELEVLDLSYNAQITGKGLANLAGLRRLEMLTICPDEFSSDPELSTSQLGDEGVVAVGTMQSLVDLNLPNSKITDAGIRDLGKLKAVEEIDLSASQITGAGTGSLADCPSLRSLDLSGSPVDDAGLAELAKITQLTALNLKETKITDAGLAQLEKLPNLSRLWLPAEPQVTAAAVEKLKKALTKLEDVFQN